MHAALEIVLLEVSSAASASQNLSFHDILHLLPLSKLFSNQERFLSVESDVSNGNGNSVLAEELASLIFMELHSSER
jgi:hypothetical protein